MKSAQRYDLEGKTTLSAYNYLYNGKELQDEAGWDVYDFGFRYYDPVIARWFVQDPLAENHYDLSPYDFVGGNPISRIDILGLDWFHNDSLGYQWFDSSKKTHTDADGNEYTNKGHTYSYQDEDGLWHNYYQNFGLVTENKIEDMQSFLTGSSYWFGRSRDMLDEKYYNELYTDAWAADRNASSRAVLSWIAGITGGIIGAAELGTASVTLSDEAFAFIARSEAMQSTHAANTFMKEWTSTWLVHSKVGSWITATASSFVPEGAVAGGYVVYTGSKEVTARFYKELVKLFNQGLRERQKK